MGVYYVGIDPSLSNTGVCILGWAGDLIGAHDTKDLKLKSSEPFERLKGISDFVLSLLPTKSIVHVGYENYSYGSTNKAYLLGELGGVLKLALYYAVDSMTLFAPKTVKSFAVHNGDAGKDLMIAQATSECPELLGFKKLSSDICDSYFLAKAALFLHSPEVAVTTNAKEYMRHRLEVIKNAKFSTIKRGTRGN